MKDKSQVLYSETPLEPSINRNSRYKATLAVLSGSLLIALVVIGYLVRYNKQLRQHLFSVQLEKTVISPPETGEFLDVMGSFRIENLGKDIEIHPSWPVNRSACSGGYFESYTIEKPRSRFSVEATRLSFNCEQLPALEIIERDLALAPWEGWEAWQSFEELPRVELPSKNVTFTVVGYPGEASLEFIGVAIYRARQLYVVRGSYEGDFEENPNALFLKEVLQNFEALDL